MHLYMSGTPRNDPYQTVENRINTHRLFSMHGEYEKAVTRWLQDLKEGILDADNYLKAYPQHIDLIKGKDIRRRVAQADYGRTDDWDTAEILELVCKKLESRPHPRAIMLDSGAFTAWNRGEATTVDDVKRKYSKFINASTGMFDEIWGINLDVIPGEKGRDATVDELKRAVEVSDVNFEILVKEFGNIILPVYHQGESIERLEQCVDQVNGLSDYICVSPRNDLSETHRVTWSRDAHAELTKRFPHIKTHGLATTGNKMMRTVPWYSGDSAAWVQHGGYGMIDIFHDEKHSFGRKNDPHYKNYFVSFDSVSYDLYAKVSAEDGSIVTGMDLGLTGSEGLADGAKLFKQAGVKPDNFPLIGGHKNDENKSYFMLSDDHKKFIRERVEALGFPFEMCMWDSRVRNLICMAEFVTFAEWAKTSRKDGGQQYLLGDL